MRTSQRIANGTAVFPVLMRWAAIVLATASPALACPTSDDLKKGIIVIEAKEVPYVYIAEGGNVVQQQIFFDRQNPAINRLAHGTYVIALGTTDEDGPQAVLNYDIATSALPEPKPNTTLKFVTSRSDSGQPSYQEIQSQAWSAQTQYSIGDCTYAAIEGQFTYTSDFGSIDETVIYLPELGISLLTVYADSAGSFTDRFSYTQIDAL